ncbi:MAG TPA: TatD family hydrolase [Verrucomicrobiales bacterium]|nr:TatD family hydrolase [Verrucomicrobiae bacterium]MCP5553550.1 TatD family hydrolase [Akkermansiaceae bacterium]HRX54801.1 TatD family hydrolase [Verrucomicrobiales bacterium]
MKFLDSHVHMVSRTTDDYQRMAAAGTVAIIEPSFWQGQPRTEAGSFKDYFNSLIGFERFRASQFGIKHYCTIGLNPKEANNEKLADAVMELLPLYVCKEGVVGVGEIGFDDQTRLEEKYLRLQARIAVEADLPIQIHTPHRDKKAGTSRTMDVLLDAGCDPAKVIIDHNNEETVKEVLDRGFWAAFTIYPHTKLGNLRMIEIVREYGAERIIIDSAADWGISDALAVPKTAALMKEAGIDMRAIEQVSYANPLIAYGQSGQMRETDWADAAGIDPAALFAGNTLLRGGQDVHEAMTKYMVIE